jgi:hypothetical protein
MLRTMGACWPAKYLLHELYVHILHVAALQDALMQQQTSPIMCFDYTFQIMKFVRSIGTSRAVDQKLGQSCQASKLPCAAQRCALAFSICHAGHYAACNSSRCGQHSTFIS